VALKNSSIETQVAANCAAAITAAVVGRLNVLEAQNPDTVKAVWATHFDAIYAKITK
jgi:hypothetical protein